MGNYCPLCFDCILGDTSNPNYTVPHVNQVQYHVGEGVDPNGLKTYLDGKGIVMQAYSALSRGALITSNIAKAIGAAHNKSGAQVALRWVTQQGVPLVTKADDAEYLKEDLDCLDWDLTSEEVKLLDATDCAGVGEKGSACQPSYWCKQ